MGIPCEEDEQPLPPRRHRGAASREHSLVRQIVRDGSTRTRNQRSEFRVR
jgi:hypothetical protein